MNIHFHGGAREVTGALYRVETENTQFLVDCGILQGCDFCAGHNYADFPFDPGEIDFVIVTHAHMDHIGRLPKLYRAGFRGPIYTTPPTQDIADIALHDGFSIMKEEAEERGRDPLYTKKDVERCLHLFNTFTYELPTQVAEEVTVTFRNAGHILGSAIVDVKVGDTKLTFSGDLGNPPSPLLPDPAIVNDTGVVVMESTYGDRMHEEQSKRKEQLADIITATYNRGGTVLMPVFAIERTQEILYDLNELVENNKIPDIPVFVDSPMAIETTNVYTRYTDYFKKEARDRVAQGDDLFDFPGLSETRTVRASKEINEHSGPKVVMAGSGMSTGGRILHHEVRYIEDPNSTLLLVGFQAPGTLGRRFMEGEDRVKVFGDWHPVQADVRTIRSYSGHGDQAFLLEWAKHFSKTAERVFVVQGEEHASQTLAELLYTTHDLDARVPRIGDTYSVE